MTVELPNSSPPIGLHRCVLFVCYGNRWGEIRSWLRTIRNAGNPHFCRAPCRRLRTAVLSTRAGRSCVRDPGEARECASISWSG